MPLPSCKSPGGNLVCCSLYPTLHDEELAGWKDGRRGQERRERRQGALICQASTVCPSSVRPLPQGEHSQTHTGLIHAATGSSTR